MAEDSFDESSTEPVDWQRYLDILRRRRYYIVLPFFLGWVALWSVSWFLPSVYQSATLILVEQPTVSQEYVVSNVSTNMQQRLDSLKQQVLSRTLLLRIIEKLNLYPADRNRRGPDDLVERMRKNVEIELGRASDHDQLTSFTINFSYSNPYVAQQVTTELTNVLITENLEVQQEQSTHTTQFLETELDTARKKLAALDARVREFKDRHLGELPEQLGSNLQILSGLQSQLTAEQDALARAKQQNAYLESLIGQYKTFARVTKSSTGAPLTGAAGSIDQDLDKLKAQLADLSSRYTENHPDIRKLKQQIARTEKMKQQQANEAPVAGAGSAEGSTEVTSAGGKELPLMEVQSQLKANQIEISNRTRSVSDMQNKIADYQSRLNRTPVREQELADLTRDRDQSRTYYDDLLAKRNKSGLATSLAKSQQGEHFRMIDPPNLPVKPSSPNRFKLSCMGLGVGLVISVLATVVVEFLDDRVYDEKEFKKLLPAEVMVEIPPLVSGEDEQKQRKRLRLELAVAGVMAVLVMAGSAVSFLRG